MAKYEGLLTDLRLAKEMLIKSLLISYDSQLVVNQVNVNFSAKDKGMAAYLKLVMDFTQLFERFETLQIPRENSHADAFSKSTSNIDSELLIVVPIEHLSSPSISKNGKVMWVEDIPSWMRPITVFLQNRTLSSNKEEVKNLRRLATHFILQDDLLYNEASPCFYSIM